jgi:hypothetical protein
MRFQIIKLAHGKRYLIGCGKPNLWCLAIGPRLLPPRRA